MCTFSWTVERALPSKRFHSQQELMYERCYWDNIVGFVIRDFTIVFCLFSVTKKCVQCYNIYLNIVLKSQTMILFVSNSVLVIAFCAILCQGRSKSPLIDEDQGVRRRDKAAGNHLYIFFLISTCWRQIYLVINSKIVTRAVPMTKKNNRRIEPVVLKSV